MPSQKKITIWDVNANRIAEISENLLRAMQSVGSRYDLEIMSEPPLISRMGLLDRLPSFEVDGMYWTLKPGETVTQKEAEQLIRILDRQEANA